jgi:antitoxin VapB
MDGSRPVKLFRNGRNQAVRIPREFELPGQDAVMRRDGDRLIIEPAAPRRGLMETLAYLATLEPLAEDERLEPFVDSPPRPFDL